MKPFDKHSQVRASVSGVSGAITLGGTDLDISSRCNACCCTHSHFRINFWHRNAVKYETTM
eukprot:2392587-Amphidinium_carterae.1